MKWTILLLTLGSLWACKSNKDKAPMDPTPASGALILLETTPCRGYCPVYKLKFMHNGEVFYEGVRFVRSTGVSKFKLSDEELKAFKKQVETANLWQYPNSFPVTIVDAPGANITVFGKEEKTITGSVERPKPIRDLQDAMTALAGKHGINLSSVDPNALPDDAVKGEILVKLKPEINAGNWLRDLNNTSNANLKLVRRTGSENIWLVAFDQSKFTLDDVLTLLKAHEHVLEAQPNRKASERE